jgi:hypothetical protein
MGVLEGVQEKAFKMASGLKSNLYQEKGGELRLETLGKRRTDQDMAMTHKMLSDARSCENGVLKQFLETGRTTTTMASDSQNL